MTTDVQNFREDVIEASARRPVLVDFWAPWCGPCRSLGPVLEKLAAEQSDRWTLVKVNTDEYPDESRQYGVRGIPAVKLFVDGTVVDEFTGALPEYAVRQWLDKALPTEQKKKLSVAESLLESGDVEQAQTVLEDILRSEPTNAAAAGHLARLTAFDDPGRAVNLAQTARTGEPRFVQIADAVDVVASILARDLDEELNGEAGVEEYIAAVGDLKGGDFDGALNRIINVLQTNRYVDDDGARKLGVAVFTLLGDDHPVTRAHRRMFDMWLY
ncbi:MAG: thioredoxin [Rhodothermales bacterium]|nr:thioredoxin [Rhodothermales bacterium]